MIVKDGGMLMALVAFSGSLTPFMTSLGIIDFMLLS